MTNRVRYLHLRLFVDGKTECEPNGGVTVAYIDAIEVNGGKGVRQRKFGLAYCSVDDNYCKATGRSDALLRLAENPQCVHGEYRDSKGLKLLLESVGEYIAYKGDRHAERWLRKVYKHYYKRPVKLLPSVRTMPEVTLYYS